MVYARHVLDELNNLVGIVSLVVVPGNNPDELVGESDAGLGVEDGSAGRMDEVGGYDCVLSVARNAFQFAFKHLQRCDRRF